MSTTLGLKVDDDTRKRLKAIADAKDRTPLWIVKTALAEYLEREEHREKERLEDEARWERYVLTGDAVAHEKVQIWLENWAAGKQSPCPR